MRQEIVHRWRQAIRDGLTTTEAARAVHVPRATLSRWEQSPELLSRRPHRCRQGPLRATPRQRITDLRRDGHPISAATVGRGSADRAAPAQTAARRPQKEGAYILNYPNNSQLSH